MANTLARADPSIPMKKEDEHLTVDEIVEEILEKERPYWKERETMVDWATQGRLGPSPVSLSLFSLNSEGSRRMGETRMPETRPN